MYKLIIILKNNIKMIKLINFSMLKIKIKISQNSRLKKSIISIIFIPYNIKNIILQYNSDLPNFFIFTFLPKISYGHIT